MLVSLFLEQLRTFRGRLPADTSDVLCSYFSFAFFAPTLRSSRLTFLRVLCACFALFAVNFPSRSLSFLAVNISLCGELRDSILEDLGEKTCFSIKHQM